MLKISKVNRWLRLAPNKSGRDLVVGDLHGHRSLFENQLERLDFDPSSKSRGSLRCSATTS
jgi:hypothetical protein